MSRRQSRQTIDNDDADPDRELTLARIPLVVALVLSGAGGSTRALVLRVDATPKRTSSSACIFLIKARLVGGGSQTTCLTQVRGFPGPGATIHSAGTMTFALSGGAIRTRVQITQRFRADGVHARQSLRGDIVGGTRVYKRVRGTLAGGGSVIDRRAGLGRVNLRYTLVLR
jgi:hypothetical protein